MTEQMTDDYVNRPAYLRQIADEMDDGRNTPCTEASICREAAEEIERLRKREADSHEIIKALEAMKETETTGFTREEMFRDLCFMREFRSVAMPDKTTETTTITCQGGGASGASGGTPCVNAGPTDTTDDRQKEIEAWSKALARAEDLAIERKKEIERLRAALERISNERELSGDTWVMTANASIAAKARYLMVICAAGHHLTGEGEAPTECPICKGQTP